MLNHKALVKSASTLLTKQPFNSSLRGCNRLFSTSCKTHSLPNNSTKQEDEQISEYEKKEDYEDIPTQEESTDTSKSSQETTETIVPLTQNTITYTQEQEAIITTHKKQSHYSGGKQIPKVPTISSQKLIALLSKIAPKTHANKILKLITLFNKTASFSKAKRRDAKQPSEKTTFGKIVSYIKQKMKTYRYELIALVCLCFILVSVLSFDVTSINGYYIWKLTISTYNLLLAIGFVFVALCIDPLTVVGGSIATILGAKYLTEQERVSKSSEMFKEMLDEKNRNYPDHIAFALRYIDRHNGSFNENEEILSRLSSFLRHFFDLFLVLDSSDNIHEDRLVRYCFSTNSREKAILTEVFSRGVDYQGRFFDNYVDTYFRKSRVKKLLLLEKYLASKQTVPDRSVQNDADEDKLKQKLKHLLDTKKDHFFVSFRHRNGEEYLTWSPPGINEQKQIEIDIEEFKKLVVNLEKQRLEKCQSTLEKLQKQNDGSKPIDPATSESTQPPVN